MALYNPTNTLNVTKAAISQLIGKGYMDAELTPPLISYSNHSCLFSVKWL